MARMDLKYKGKRVVVTRPLSAGDEWERELRRQGAVVIHFPTIELAPVHPSAAFKSTLGHVSDFDWLVFTSPAAPRFMKASAQSAHVRLPSVQNMPRIAAIGKGTARAVRAAGHRVAFVPSRADSATLAKELPLGKTSRADAAALRVLLLRSDIAPKDLPRALRNRGAHVTDAAVYRTKLIRRPDARFSKFLISGKIDMLAFASPSAVRGFCTRVKGDVLRAAKRLPTVAIGPSVEAALKRSGFKKSARS